MNKLIAKRDFRHASRRLRVGDSFEASPRDTEYYLQYGFAEAEPGSEIEPVTSRLYDRKDMQAKDLRSTEMSAEAKNEARARAPMAAQQDAKQDAKRAPRVTAPMSTQSAAAISTAVPQQPPGVAPSTPENPAPAQVPTPPVAPAVTPPAAQPAPNVASGGGGEPQAGRGSTGTASGTGNG